MPKPKLLLQAVAPLEALHSSRRVDYPLLAGEERMALAAKFNSELFFGRTDGKNVTAGANHLSIFKKLGVNLFFHFFILQRKR